MPSTEQICKKWEATQRTLNPVTNRQIKRYGPTYQYFIDLCSNYNKQILRGGGRGGPPGIAAPPYDNEYFVPTPYNKIAPQVANVPKVPLMQKNIAPFEDAPKPQNPQTAQLITSSSLNPNELPPSKIVPSEDYLVVLITGFIPEKKEFGYLDNKAIITRNINRNVIEKYTEWLHQVLYRQEYVWKTDINIDIFHYTSHSINGGYPQLPPLGSATTSQAKCLTATSIGKRTVKIKGSINSSDENTLYEEDIFEWFKNILQTFFLDQDYLITIDIFKHKKNTPRVLLSQQTIIPQDSSLMIKSLPSWLQKQIETFFSAKDEYKPIIHRIEVANTITKFLESVMDRGKWCISGMNQTKFTKNVEKIENLSVGTFGVVYKVLFSGIQTPIAVKEAFVHSDDLPQLVTKTVEGRFKRPGGPVKKDYYSIENLFLEAIDREILQKQRSPNFLLFYETAWCYDCVLTGLITAKNPTQTGNCYLTFLEMADDILTSSVVPSYKAQYSALYQILLGFHALQKYLGIWHRDIKKDNILIRKIPPGGVFKYVVDGISYFVPNTGYQFFISDFGVSASFKPNLISKEYMSRFGSLWFGVNQIYIVHDRNNVLAYPLKVKENENIVWKDSAGNIIGHKNTTIDRYNVMTFPPTEFFSDIQDVIRMFIKGPRTEMPEDIHSGFKNLTPSFYKEVKQLGYAEQIPPFTTSARYLLAKEMFKALYKTLSPVTAPVLEEYIMD
jgi:hypothetical protein